MTSLRGVVVGLDVGDTHINAVVMQNGEILSKSKRKTADDVTSRVISAVEDALIACAGTHWKEQLEVKRIHIVTSQFLQAVVQRRRLARVAVIRLCGPASTQLPPLIDFPSDLKRVIAGPILMLDGGFHYDGKREIKPTCRQQLAEAVHSLREVGMRNLVVSGVFSHLNSQHEIQVGEWLRELYPEASVTLSHTVAQAGLLLRENSAVLNQSLKPLARRLLSDYAQAFAAKQLHCPLYLTSNNGTLFSVGRAVQLPVLTICARFASTMRGAAHLSGVHNAIVADVGGESLTVGVVVDSLPRLSSSKAEVGGVNVNILMPDTVSTAPGGGVPADSRDDGQTAVTHIGTELEKLISAVQASATKDPLILVGGASAIISPSWSMTAISRVIRPPYCDVANAVGTAMCTITAESASTEALSSDVSDALDGSMNELHHLGADDSIGVEVDKQEKYHGKDGVLCAVAGGEPCVDAQTGEWTLTAWDVECLAVGAGILGCGGGGSTYTGKLKLLQALEHGQTIRVIHPLRFAREAGVRARAVPVSYMGAPTVVTELMCAEAEMDAAVTAMRKLYGCGGYQDGKLRNTDGVEVKEEDTYSYISDYKPAPGPPQYPELELAALTTFEIGGSNSMEPLCLGAALGLPVLDCDCMGRAFPKLHMCSTFRHGARPAPAVLASADGRAAVCLSSRDAHVLEDHFRTVCIEMGCLAAILGPPLTPHEVADKTVLYSMSRAWRLGRAVLMARAEKQSPVDAILKHEGGKLLLTGKVVAVERETTGGFANGWISMHGSGGEWKDRACTIIFHNEYIIAKEVSEAGNMIKVLCTVPDLISLVDLGTGEPIASDEVRYGLRVAVLGLPAPPILTSPLALETLGPQAFGLTGEEAEYHSLGQSVQHDPVPLL